MRWRRVLSAAGLVVVSWTGLAAWQYDEYGRECELARQIVHRQAESLVHALVGGIRSHRRLGRYFPEQLQAALDELAAAHDVLAAAVVSEQGRLVLVAGQTELLGNPPRQDTGIFWESNGLRYAMDFRLEPEAPGGGAGPGGGPRGWGRGPGGRWAQDAAPASPFAAGGRFVAIVLLDRSTADTLQRRAWGLRAAVVLAGGLGLVLIAAVWCLTMGWVEAAGRARVFEIEARYLRELSQAAAGLAHETRNPLGLIRGWMQRLADAEPSSPELAGKAQAVVEECDRITARINQFLSFAKPCDPRPASVDLVPLIDQLAGLLQPDLEAKDLTLIKHVHGPNPAVHADPEMLRQALFNLMCNAIQFSPEQGTIEIVVRSAENRKCRLEVADRGPGVSPSHTDRLFTPYFTTRPGGTGLGLALVRRIATAHGWQCGYTPRPGGGSVFWLDGLHA